MISRLLLIKLHALIASFFLPIAIAILVSGALYTVGVKGKSQKTTLKVTLEKPFTPNLELLTRVAIKALQDRQLPLPNGDPYIKKKKKKYRFHWNDLKYSVLLTPTKQPNAVKVTFHERNFLAQIMRIHKGGAGDFFEAATIAMVIALVLVLISGVIMAQSMPVLRKPSWIALGLGTASMAVLMTIL